MKKRFLACVLAVVMAIGVCVPALDADAAKKSKTKKEEKKWTFDDIDEDLADYVIEANVRLLGKGDGYHAKLVFVTPTSGFSFGIQYDNGASPPYTNKAMLIAENIKSNDPGGQKYDRPGDIEVHLGKTYHLMMSLDENGKIATFFNGKKIGTYVNKKLAYKYGREIRPRVEASGKHNGDIVRADFSHINIRDGDVDVVEAFWAYSIDTASKIKSTIHEESHVSIYGKLTGLQPYEDWDSAYEAVSGIVQYNFD